MARPLPLAARDVGAPLGYRSFETFRHRFDEVASLGYLERFPHLRFGGVGFAVAEVGGDGAGEQVGLLGNQADRSPQGVRVDVANVYPVDQHPSFGGVEQAGDQVDQGGFSGAGRADHGGGLPGQGREADVAENRLGSARVTEPDLLETPGCHGGGVW